MLIATFDLLAASSSQEEKHLNYAGTMVVCIHYLQDYSKAHATTAGAGRGAEW